MSVSTDTERIFRIGGYVKRAKLNLRNEREIRAFHRNAIERRFGDFEDGTLVDVYIDITGYKETAKRPEMLRLMRDCADGKVNLIFAETKGYLTANTREFCYSYISYWREAGREQWNQARWFNGMDAAQAADENKTIVCGHWHTSYGHSKYEHKGTEFGEDADFSPYYGPGIIAIDACTAFSGKVNCLVIED